MHRLLLCVSIALSLTGCGGLGNPEEPQCDPKTIRAPGGVTDAILLAADASSPTDVWAVGSSRSFKLSAVGLVLHWDGERWAQTEIDRAEHVYDVTVVAPDDVWALGSPRDFDHDDWLGHWDGTRWSEVEPPPEWELVNPSAIAAVATDDVWLAGTDFGASGNDETPYIAHWNGAHWSRSELGVGRGLLEDVSAFSADSVWAAGYEALNEFGEEEGTLVFRWNGEEWLRVATPNAIDGLDNITATGSDEAWVVPDYFTGEHSPLWRWDGSTWTLEASPIDEISVMSAVDGVLWAAGSQPTGVAIAHHLDGSEWEQASIENARSLDSSDPFPGLAAVSETTAWGVGREPVASRACVR